MIIIDAVKLSFTQLVGESIAAISVPLEAISKLENMNHYGKRLSESAVYLYENGFFSDLETKASQNL